MLQPRWLRVFAGIGMVALLIAPIILVLFRQPWLSGPLSVVFRKPRQDITSERYHTESQTPEYTIRLTDLSYLDYMTAKLGIWNEQVIVDLGRASMFLA